MWPPESVKTTSTPASVSAAAARLPPWTVLIGDLPLSDANVLRPSTIRLSRMQGRATPDLTFRRGSSSAPWWRAVRIVASAVMLALLLPRMHLGALLPPEHQSDTVAYLLLALLTTFGGIVLSAWP